MTNPWRGEVAIVVDGVRHEAKLTLGALAELEEDLEAGSLVELVERFEADRYTAREVVALLAAGLRAGGWSGSASDLLRAEIDGGPIEATRVAGQLLARAFELPA